MSKALGEMAFSTACSSTSACVCICVCASQHQILNSAWAIVRQSRIYRLSAAEEDAGQDLEYYTAEDDEGEQACRDERLCQRTFLITNSWGIVRHTEPHGGDGRLDRLLVALLDLLAGLAAAGLLLLDELQVRASLLRSLRLESRDEQWLARGGLHLIGLGSLGLERVTTRNGRAHVIAGQGGQNGDVARRLQLTIVWSRWTVEDGGELQGDRSRSWKKEMKGETIAGSAGSWRCWEISSRCCELGG